jgi:hypothetical protein
MFRNKKKANYEAAWKDGGLVGIKVGKKQERERILEIFHRLNSEQLSKQDFTAKFINLIGE